MLVKVIPHLARIKRGMDSFKYRAHLQNVSRGRGAIFCSRGARQNACQSGTLPNLTAQKERSALFVGRRHAADIVCLQTSMATARGLVSGSDAGVPSQVCVALVGALGSGKSGTAPSIHSPLSMCHDVVILGTPSILCP